MFEHKFPSTHKTMNTTPLSHTYRRPYSMPEAFNVVLNLKVSQGRLWRLESDSYSMVRVKNPLGDFPLLLNYAQQPLQAKFTIFLVQYTCYHLRNQYIQKQLLVCSSSITTEKTLRCVWLVAKFPSQDAGGVSDSCAIRDTLIPLQSQPKIHIDLAEDVI